mgnify:CR=1 FL=1
MTATQFKRLSLFETERPLSALLLLRFGFFGLLAYDLWSISLSHAPRYGAGGFNVAHLDLLNLFSVPTPSSIGAVYLVAGALSIWIAVGMMGRVGVALCTALYTFAYFWSQADSYQHHYLLCLCLFLFMGMPWEKNKSTALNALMLQMSLIYAWTAVAKVEPVWLSGDTLNKLVAAPDVRETVISTGAYLGLNMQETFKLSAWAVMLGEFFAALAFLVRPLRSLAFFIVPWFHIMVEWIGFDIELFSYYMLLLNLALLSPERLWHWPEALYRRLIKNNDVTAGNPEDASKPNILFAQQLYVRLILATLAGIISALTIFQIHLEGSTTAAVLSSVLITLAVFSGLSSSILPSSAGKISSRKLSCTLISLLIAGSGHFFLQSEVSSASFRFDYYRMWGGDLKRRGQDQQALEIYQKANQAQASHLPARFIPAGDLAIKLGQTELGLEYLKEGAHRRLLNLEVQIQKLLESPQKMKNMSRKEFERAARSATQAQQKLYRTYLQTKDPRAQEARYGLETIQQMIQQTRAQQ